MSGARLVRPCPLLGECDTQSGVSATARGTRERVIHRHSRSSCRVAEFIRDKPATAAGSRCGAARGAVVRAAADHCQPLERRGPDRPLGDHHVKGKARAVSPDKSRRRTRAPTPATGQLGGATKRNTAAGSKSRISHGQQSVDLGPRPRPHTVAPAALRCGKDLFATTETAKPMQPVHLEHLALTRNAQPGGDGACLRPWSR